MNDILISDRGDICYIDEHYDGVGYYVTTVSVQNGGTYYNLRSFKYMVEILYVFLW